MFLQLDLEGVTTAMNLLIIIFLALIIVLAVLFYCYPKTFVNASLRLIRPLRGFKTKQVSVDGYVWHYLDSADGKVDGKETMVLVHGFGSNKDNWLLYAPYLMKKQRIITVDLPGFGDNLKDSTLSYHTIEQAKRLHRFIHALGLERVHLLGNSMGGLIVTRYGLLYPEAPLSITLMNSAGVKSDNQSALEIAAERGENPLLVKKFDEMDGLIKLIFHKPAPMPTILKRHLFDDITSNYDFYDAIFWGVVNEALPAGIGDELPTITAPVLVVWGEYDQVLDVSCAHRIKEKLPDSTVVIFDDVGHVPMVEVPKLAAEAQQKFFDGLNRVD